MFIATNYLLLSFLLLEVFSPPFKEYLGSGGLGLQYCFPLVTGRKRNSSGYILMGVVMGGVVIIRQTKLSNYA